MKKSTMMERAQHLEAMGGNFSNTIDTLIAEGMLMPPCNKYGNYDWDKEEEENASDATDTRES